MQRIFVALLLACGLLTLADTVFAADVANGEKLARRWCATCHVVATDQRQGSTQAAPFSEVAKQADFDGGKLALFLLAPHPPMPDMNLSRNEAADLAAYIATQSR